MENLTLEEKFLISGLVEGRLKYLQKNYLMWQLELDKKSQLDKNGNCEITKYYEDAMKADQERIDLCSSILSKIKSSI